MHGISRKCFCFRKLLLRISNKFSLLFYISRKFSLSHFTTHRIVFGYTPHLLNGSAKTLSIFPQNKRQPTLLLHKKFLVCNSFKTPCILLEKSEVSSMCGNTTAAEKSFVLREPEVNIPKAPHSILHVEWLGVCSCKRNYLGGGGGWWLSFLGGESINCSCIIMTTPDAKLFRSPAPPSPTKKALMEAQRWAPCGQFTYGFKNAPFRKPVQVIPPCN